MLIGQSQGEKLGLETRKRNPIDNFRSNAAANAEMQAYSDAVRRDYPNAIHRPTRPSDQYNCHGLTFAGRRTAICQGSEVEKIIRDDDYEQVELNDICPGDVVVYRSQKEVTHSGIVVGFRDKVPLILSKWGYLHEVVHKVNDCLYPHPVTYYRIVA